MRFFDLRDEPIVRKILDNSAMEHTNMDPDVADEINRLLANVAVVMAAPEPPSQQWWTEYCFLLDGEMFPGVLAGPSVECFNEETNYVAHWNLIQMTFHFIIGYKVSTYSTGAENDEYLSAIEGLLNKIKVICEQDEPENHFVIVHGIEGDFERLASLADRYLRGTDKKTSADSETVMQGQTCAPKRRVNTLGQDICFWLIKRSDWFWKHGIMRRRPHRCFCAPKADDILLVEFDFVQH